MGFKASLSNTAKVMTILVSIVIIISLLPSFIFIEVPDHFKIIISLLMTAAIVISWGFHTTGYKIFGRELIIKRPFGDKTFDLRDIRNAEKIAATDLRFSLRTFGNGGFFGYYGKFWNRKFGSMTWFATNLDNAVLLTIDGGRKIVVTPDEPENFIDAITHHQ